MNRIARRISYIFLCTLPFLDLVVVGVRALRIPGVYQGIGGVLFAVIVIAAGSASRRHCRDPGCSMDHALSVGCHLAAAGWG